MDTNLANLLLIENTIFSFFLELDPGSLKVVVYFCIVPKKSCSIEFTFFYYYAFIFHFVAWNLTQNLSLYSIYSNYFYNLHFFFIKHTKWKEKKLIFYVINIQLQYNYIPINAWCIVGHVWLLDDLMVSRSLTAWDA